MNNRDKDYRYMAISDLATELSKDTFKLDTDSEKKIVSKLLELVINDSSSDIQSLAVKCLGPLIAKINDERIEEIVNKLSSNLLDEKNEDLRDICSIGIKTLITEIPEDKTKSCQLIVKKLTPRLISAIGNKDSPPDVQLFTLELLSELLSRFRQKMSDFEKIQKVILPHLTSKRSATRKRAVTCLSHISIQSNDKVFGALVDHLLASVEKTKKPDNTRTYIQCFGSISRTVGFRLGKHLERVMAVILKFADHDKEPFSEDDELRGICFETFESLILRCPAESKPFLDKIIELCLNYIKYDPNYNYDSDEEEDDMELDEYEEDDEFDDEEEDYDDDDDMSWKVRKASSRCISAIISTRPERLSSFYDNIAPILVKRFKEREENVRLDIFQSFIALLKQTQIVTKSGEKTVLDKLRSMVPTIVSSVSKEMKSKSTRNVKTKIGIFQLLNQLVLVLPGALEKNVGDIVPGIVISAGEKSTSSPLRIEAITFTALLIYTHDRTSLYPHWASIIPPVVSGVGDSYFKVAACSLKCCQELCKVLRPEEGSATEESDKWEEYVSVLHKGILSKLKAQDIDIEVKEQAITAAGILLSKLGDKLGEKEINNCLQILLDRLRNEITRVVTVKAFDTLCTSTYKIDLSTVLADILKELATFLKKQNRQLKQSTLIALQKLVKKYGKSKAASGLYKELLECLAKLINDSDLHLSHLSLKVASTILHVHSSSGSSIKDVILPKCVELLKSSLLQGLALESMLGLYKEMVTSKSKHLTFDNLLASLLSLASSKGKVETKSFSSVSQCIAVLCSNTTDEKRDSTVNKFVSDIKKKSTSDTNKLLALYCVGEIGRRVDLSGITSLKKNILNAFESPSEEVKAAASVSLGNIAIGNLKKFLPDILAEVEKYPKRQYLLLGSLREIIVRQCTSSRGAKRLKDFFDSLMDLLFKNTETEEEGTRNVVAECLGKLALLRPKKVIPALKERTKSDTTHTRATVMTAIKFTISEEKLAGDEILEECITDFLNLLKDKELSVRRAALFTINYCAHHKPSLIRPHLKEYLPILLGETKVKPELIREVDLGPFKHKVDDGLELRKASFECMYTFLDTCIDKIDFVDFTTHMISGLSDHYDIKMLNHLILSRLAHRAGASLAGAVEKFIEPLRKTINEKVRDGAIKQEAERKEELKRSALRAIYEVNKIENIEQNQKWNDFMKNTVTCGEIGERYKAISKELMDSGRGFLSLSASMEISRD